MPENKRLKRLDRSLYRGRAYVHWSMTLEGRASGWLDPSFHSTFRIALFHSTARYFLCCPVYCLMPDHLHLLLIGLHERSEQLNAVAYLRRTLKSALGTAAFQDQAYDNVLRDKDRERDAFPDVVGYILRNPVRAELVEEWPAWPYSGAVFPGYPKLDPRKEHFWQNFWTAYKQQSAQDSP